RSYRIKHLAHHKWLNTDKDPDFNAKTDANWRFPMHPQRLIRILMVQLSGLGIFETFKVMSGKQVKTKKLKTPLSYTLSRLFYYVAIIFILVYMDLTIYYFLYWFIPYATWTQLANRLRRIAEHSSIPLEDVSLQTRTTTHGILARIFLAPKNISLHNEHHLYPGVPCYNLPKLHKALLKNTLAKENLYVSKNYSAVLKDLLVQ
ncbi:MAG: fatty acid desaturase, partial [Bacteroidia bacterium]